MKKRIELTLSVNAAETILLEAQRIGIARNTGDLGLLLDLIEIELRALDARAAVAEAERIVAGLQGSADD